MIITSPPDFSSTDAFLHVRASLPSSMRPEIIPVCDAFILRQHDYARSTARPAWTCPEILQSVHLSFTKAVNASRTTYVVIPRFRIYMLVMIITRSYFIILYSYCHYFISAINSIYDCDGENLYPILGLYRTSL